ncbi:phosphotransferase [Paenibacillus sp.]|jgi:Ser/Thr protein kinase RdoA (MazF antagonist)|uniref:phosphotransferase enzyme family protein n=1 Tax=Paenibacillus sp. TaxID=58172 RepID=UPI00281D771E|nr:phosphotransferase [Paenibacillus sp.]MDR0267781.1 phosphotransferase [Paenibacillus sp.]
MINQQILDQVIKLLGDPSADAKLLGGYFNNVYEIQISGTPIIAKLFKREDDPEELVLSEIEWVQFLHEYGLNVSVPLLVEGSYINSLPEDMFFVAYPKVAGSHVDIRNEKVWNNQLFYGWGKSMGKMHSLSRKYNPRHDRPKWHEHKLYHMNMDQFDAGIQAKWNHYLNEMKAMNQTKDSFGIIHGDLHHHNLFYDEGKLTFIDFGDSEWNWFAYDIAIVVYHASLPVKDAALRARFAAQFYESFIDGYVTENTVDSISNQIDYFINFRHLYSYVYHSQFLDEENITEAQLQYLEHMKNSLLEQDSFLGISLAAEKTV